MEVHIFSFLMVCDPGSCTLTVVPPSSHKELSLCIRENVCFVFSVTYIFTLQVSDVII